MNRDLKEKWLASLRSGQYQQGQGWLCREDRYCCLGVLADLLGVLTWARLGGTVKIKGIEDTLGEFACSLPPAVLQAAGLDDAQQRYLAKLNDSGRSFTEIADQIEQHII